ncbi:MAG: DUF4062 domain-containing protein [Gemmataceae bacterium]|nr:DUF4062 domain-containing protein [Gemmataceae bacterium]
MSSAWRTVRVFLSSTFRDMHAERDHLIKVTFPSLREKLLPFRVELYDIDLRWGITEDEAKNEKVIGLCLDQVDECRPFFLAFLGHRYGWVPGQVPDEIQKRFPFVSQFPDVSVTELELRHALANPESARPLILFRTPDTIETIPEATRKRDFLETDPNLRQKLDALRKELEAGPYPVQPYSAHWDPKRYDRVYRTEGKLVGLDDFGKRVEDWLWQAIQNELQFPDTPAEIDPLDAEADLHERFIELRTRIYIGRDELYRQLEEFALGQGELPLLLSGESGLGKSAALARFVRDFRTKHPEVFVLPHFVGASPRTTSLAAMLQRLTQELQRKYALTLPKAESPEEILRTFVVAITSLPESARVVLVFDALNQLDADSRAETLAWLPEQLPANVRVLCSAATSYSPLAPVLREEGPGVRGVDSTTPHPQSLSAEYKGEGRTVPRVLTAFGERKHISVLLRPLSDDERRAIIKAVPRLVAKSLADEQIDKLLANPATQNPLFLMVALEELRGYGSFENLDKLIAKLPRDGDALTKLFEQVFQRLEKEFGQRLVEQASALLACARRGLSGSELEELTRPLGPQAEDLYPLLRQLEPYLQRREGRYDFYHMSIRRAVEVHYLKWEDEEDQHDPWLRWNPDRQTPASEPTEPERETRHLLIDFFENDRLSPRSVDELPWQLAQLRSWQRLFDLLGDLAFFDVAWQADQFEVRIGW